LTVGAWSLAGTLGTRIHQVPPRDPESQSVVARQRVPGDLVDARAEVRGPADYNGQLALSRASELSLHLGSSLINQFCQRCFNAIQALLDIL
jgi:hypothetical protein